MGTGSRIMRVAAVAAVLMGVLASVTSAQAGALRLSVTASELIAPWASDFDGRFARVTATSSEPGPITVTIRHDGRRALTFSDVASGETVDFRILTEFADGEWTVTAEFGAERATVSLQMASRWAPMSDRRQRFPKCSDVHWYLDHDDTPSGDAGLSRDIEAALAELGAATGLTFVPVDRLAQANLVYSWSALGGGWTQAMGGSRILDDGTYQGYVALDSESEWARRPGFGYSDGQPGRGVLLLHETGHALGLGHVSDVHQIMFPSAVQNGPSHLASGDLAGLAWLYQPHSCETQSL